MRRASRIAAIGALLLGAGISQAATVVYSVRSAGVGTPDIAKPTGTNNQDGTEWQGNAGFDVIRFYAKFTVGGPEASSLGVGSIAGTMTSSAPFKLGYTQVGAIADVNRPYANLDLIATTLINNRVLNDAVDVHTDNENVNTMIYIADWDFQTIGPTPTNMTIASQNVTPSKSSIQNATNVAGGTTPRRIDDNVADIDPRYLYQNPTLYTWNANGQPALGLTEFRVEGAVLKNPTSGQYDTTSPDPTALPSNPNGNRGALVAIAVVPTGATVRFRGLQAEAQGVADTNNNLSFFDITDAIPEPGSISLLTLGAIGLLARRSRKQA